MHNNVKQNSDTIMSDDNREEGFGCWFLIRFSFEGYDLKIGLANPIDTNTVNS